jgi:predicted 3-demethylubiquinone-9 3-methyltransferase (glyoxalase superfamily)
MQKITPLMMFEGAAEAAMNFYISLFNDGKINELIYFKDEFPGKEGLVKQASFSIQNQELRCFDSPVKHDFTFTPSISLFIICETETEVDFLFAKLSEGGKIFMALDNYPFSPRFGWCSDKFGVSWQINLKK